MEARNRHLPDWFTRIRTRQITLPRFQRFEAWSHHQVTALLNTVLQQLPAGAVLVLEIGDTEPFISRPVQGAPEEGERITEQLLDGQQRLTALWRSLKDDYEDRSYFVKFEKDEESGAQYYVESQSRWMKNDKRYPVWADSPEQLWEKKLLPISLVRPDTEAEAELKKWAKDATQNDMDSTLEIMEHANHIRQRFSLFNIPFLSLPSTTSKEIALNVFIQMNTSATALSAYDIVVAQVEAGTGESLHDLIEDLKQKIPHVEEYLESSDWMLSVAAILQNKTPTRSTFLHSDFSKQLIEDWEKIKTGIRRAVDFLESEKVFDNKRLPTDVVLYPLAALWSLVPDGLDAEGDARNILQKYLWRAFFTERYERTSATRALVDFRQLRALILHESDEMPLIFDENEFPLPQIEEIKLAGWPTRKDRLPRALLALAIREGGVDFADGQTAARGNLSTREYHHLYPDSWLKKHNYTDNQIFRSLNCGLVTWRTNRTISAKSPSVYIAERMEKSALGEKEIIRRLDSHLIPHKAIVSDNYEIFLQERAELMHNSMRDVCGGSN